MTLGLVLGFIGGMALAIPCCAAAYRNGCCDGYGYSRDPRCPGYAKAGKHLCRTMASRWPELKDGP
jgi:hypothetical protein